MRKVARGFTLIELLVVIAIIGILASIVLVNLTAARGKGRDANRISEMRQINYALELYFETNNSYPQCLYVGGTCATTLQGSPALPSVPKDPSTGIGYSYAAFGSGATCSSYHLGVSLEDIKGNVGILSSDADKLVASAPTVLCTNSAADFSGISAAASGVACAVANGTGGAPAGNESCYDLVQ